MNDTKPISVLIGGPSYRLQCSARNRDASIRLGIALASARVRVGTLTEHGIPVELARHNLMRRALDSGADFFLSMDSDVWIEDTESVIGAIGFAKAEELPLIAWPCKRVDGLSNVRFASWIPPEDVPPGVHAVDAVGMAAVLFNLNWYREHWSEGPWFRTEWTSSDDMESEDTWHCLQLRERWTLAPIVIGNTWAHHAHGLGVL